MIWEFTFLTTSASPITIIFGQSPPPGFSLCHGGCRQQLGAVGSMVLPSGALTKGFGRILHPTKDIPQRSMWACQNPHSPWHLLGENKTQLSFPLPSGEENLQPQCRFCCMDAVCEQFIYLFTLKAIEVNFPHCPSHPKPTGTRGFPAA